MSRIAEWIRHNQGAFVAVLVCVGLVVWLCGCEAKVNSLIEPGLKVTRAGLGLEVSQEAARLEAEVKARAEELGWDESEEAARLEVELESLLERAEVKLADLDRQDTVKQKVLNFALLAAETGTLNVSGVVGLLVGVLGIGAVVDNRIKDKVIKNRPLNGVAEENGVV